jgi:hypothetical protein
MAAIPKQIKKAVALPGFSFFSEYVLFELFKRYLLLLI